MLSRRVQAIRSQLWLHLALVLAVAAFFRLWQISFVPPGLFGDEAADGMDALDVLAGRGAVFFPANYGREGLHMWILAATFRLMGISPLAVRLPSAVAGILTALATYWLGRELAAGPGNLSTVGFCKQDSSLPLLAALYLSTSYWHVHFSRFGVRGVFTPLCGALAFAAFWRGVNLGHDTRRSRASHVLFWFGASGFFLGLATYFYTASRFFPLFLGVFLALEALAAWVSGRWREAILCRHWRGLLLLFLVAVLVFSPLGHYFVTHPGSFTRRASVVSVARAADPLRQMAQAAMANVAQFFLPGHGDDSWNYNLPHRSVFEPLSALLAIIGVVVLMRFWRRPTALFLLTWFPTMLLPAILATDRWPTLPRVLGVIPGVYFFPAIGLSVLAALPGSLVKKCSEARPRAVSQRPRTGLGAIFQYSPGVRPRRMGIRAEAGHWVSSLLWAGLVIVSLAVHGVLAYRDYFKVWAPAQETFDAFDGDMVAAWQWMRAHEPLGHVYLSSDIYRHPTYMFLGEHATVVGYFQHANPRLSWFDARGALPLPPAGKPATYLLTAGSTPLGRPAEFLAIHGIEHACLPAPDGSCALRVVELPAGAGWDLASGPALVLTDHLTLTGAEMVRSSADGWELWLHWCTSGPDPAAWAGYELEVEGGELSEARWHALLSLQSFRPMEWVPAGCFVTWHRLEQPIEPQDGLTMRLRLLRLPDREPVVGSDAPDGWHAIRVELDG